MEEIEIMYAKAFKMKEDEYRFLAAIQGVELGDSNEESVQDKIDKARAKARAQVMGISEEEYELEGMFTFIDEDELT